MNLTDIFTLQLTDTLTLLRQDKRARESCAVNLRHHGDRLRVFLPRDEGVGEETLPLSSQPGKTAGWKMT